MEWTVMAVFIALFIILGFWFIKMEHHGRKIKIVLILIAVLLLYFSVVHVFNSNDVDLKSPGGVVKAVYAYFGWIGRSVGNLWDVGRDTTGRVVQAVQLNETEG